MVIEDHVRGTGCTIKEGATVVFSYTVSSFGSKSRSSPSKVEVNLGNKRKSLTCWSMGIPGMKVGGTRQIASPAVHAYGKKGIPPFIPEDTAVVFIIELISVK